MKSPIFFLGSLPFATTQEAISFVKNHAGSLPFLPQLPEANPQEDMLGQVLRGMELGFWDELTASCLELFQNEFAERKRIKLQIAGPFTIARSLSTTMKEVERQWLPFWEGLCDQLDQGGFRGEIWLQIDEPFWSGKMPLPETYPDFLGAVQSIRPKLKVGVHSCAHPRPLVSKELREVADFFSFDFTQTPMTPDEKRGWENYLKSTKALILGVLEKGKSLDMKQVPLAKKFPKKVWLSTSCGLYGWTPKEIAKSLEKWGY